MTASSPVCPARFCSRMLSANSHGWPERKTDSAVADTRKRSRGTPVCSCDSSVLNSHAIFRLNCSTHRLNTATPIPARMTMLSQKPQARAAQHNPALQLDVILRRQHRANRKENPKPPRSPDEACVVLVCRGWLYFGRLIVNSEPWLTWLATVTLPPWASTTALTKLRPRPRPRWDRLLSPR